MDQNGREKNRQSADGWSVLEVRLPREVFEHLHQRVDRLDTSINDWIVTVVIEALERPEPTPRINPHREG